MPYSGQPHAIHNSRGDVRNGTETVAVTFAPVHVGRTSNLIVNQIRLLIRNGRLTPGDRLPTERELSEQFCVSRVTVREAMRALEATGLVTIRVGARGGAFVTAPTIQLVGEGIADLLAFSVVRLDEVTEARRAFELSIIPLVCQRADEHDITDLLEICDAATATPEPGDERGMSACSTFHIRMAGATHNAAVEMLARSLDGQLLTSLLGAHHGAEAALADNGEHRDLVLAVRRRDCEAARAILATHLDCTPDLAALPDRPLLVQY